MFEKLDAPTITFILFNAAGLVAAFRAWAHSKEARALLEEFVADMGEDLKTHIITTVAEGADQVIAKLPVKRTAKTEPPAAPPVAS
jgi:hypothetical protein